MVGGKVMVAGINSYTAGRTGCTGGPRSTGKSVAAAESAVWCLGRRQVEVGGHRSTNSSKFSRNSSMLSFGLAHAAGGERAKGVTATLPRTRACPTQPTYPVLTSPVVSDIHFFHHFFFSFSFKKGGMANIGGAVFTVGVLYFALAILYAYKVWHAPPHGHGSRPSSFHHMTTIFTRRSGALPRTCPRTRIGYRCRGPRSWGWTSGPPTRCAWHDHGPERALGPWPLHATTIMMLCHHRGRQIWPAYCTA